MRKVLLLDASIRNGFTSQVTLQLKEHLSKNTAVEVIELKNYRITRCKGCCACLSVGSSSCPLKEDDVKEILEKIEQSDGVIFVVPNYALSVPGILKDLLDRLAYVFHRPRLFGKVCLPVIVQGVYGGNKITKYVNEVMGFWGMKGVKGVVVSGGIYPKKGQKVEVEEKNNTKLSKATERFLKALNSDKPVQPTLFKLMIYRMTRSSMRYFDDVLEPDQKYYASRGWLESDYYYEVQLNLFKKFVGKFFDNMIRRMAKKEEKKKMVRE